MEGLVSCGIIPVRVFGVTKQRSRFLSASALHLRKGAREFRIGMVKKQCSPFSVAAAAAASVGVSQVGHFENTLPSKGFIQGLNIYFIYIEI